MSDSSETTFRAVVLGRVQGVGFRYFVLREAERLALAGEVRNLQDGSVEVKARGPRAKLEALAEILKKGPALSRVKDVKMDWGLSLEPFEGFSIMR